MRPAQKVQFTSELVLTVKASKNADTDMNASAMRHSHQAKLVQLTSLPAISGTFNFLFKVLWYLFAIVSNIYCASDEVYHTLCALLPRNVTLTVHTVRAGVQMTDKTLACSGNLFQGVCICAHAGVASCDHKSRLESPDFHAEPIPIHSPLLRKYYFVSFPPLTCVLKFTRFSGLTSCLRIKKNTLRLDHTKHHS